MDRVKSAIKKLNLIFAAALLAVSIGALSGALSAQDTVSAAAETVEAGTANDIPDFRIEKVPVAGGAEILTILSRTDSSETEMPMVSILRDTLGDDRPENDQLRYVWMLTYTKGSVGQKLAAFVPFLYTRTTNHLDIGSGPPTPVADIRRSDKKLWNTVLWTVFKKVLLSQAGMGARATVLQYRQNVADHRQAAIARALSVLSLYESVNGEKLLSDSEMKDIQARLWLTDKSLGWHMQDENLSRVYDKELSVSRDIRGHNWELLRQYSEGQGLYFEPLVMADGVARHAIVWTSAEDVAANRGRNFDARFLNIKDPWNDGKLGEWNGYSQVRWFDDENRVVDEGTPNAHSRTMIPLAIYGLDNPKIPTLLVDFRDNGNPKRREMSRRVLHDITDNIFAISSFSSLPYFLGRYIYDYVTGRRGMDINQASRVRAYAAAKNSSFP